MKKGDFILLMLYAPGFTAKVNEAIVGRTKLTKLIFLFEKEAQSDFKKAEKQTEQLIFPEFFPWKYGPMSKDILVDLEFFLKLELVEAKAISDPSGFLEFKEFQVYESNVNISSTEDSEYSYDKFWLSDIGKKYIEEKILHKLSHEQLSIISDIKRKYNSMSLNDLLEYVYKTYPKYAEKSIIRDTVLNY